MGLLLGRCAINAIKAFNRWLGLIVTVIAAILLAVTTIVIFLQVVFRYFINQPLHWTEETARFLFIWVALLGAAMAFKDRTHFSISMFTDTLPAPVRKGIEVLVALGTTWLLGLMLREGLYVAQLNHIQESPAIGVPMSIPYMAIPVGSLLGIIFVWLDVLIHWNTAREASDTNAEDVAAGSHAIVEEVG
ncbi:MAG TPA: TRAP transporter small permease [Chloroflexota bacterium]|nr:TRAP transporter small permease [Chloroflexota bacterium]